MEFVIKTVVGTLLTLWAALVAWWLFPDRIIDLSYWEWALVSLSVETIVGAAIGSHEIVKG